MLSTKIMGGVSVFLGLSVVFLFRANASLNEEVGAARVSIAQAEAANQSNVLAIDALRAGLGACVSDRAVDEEQNRIVVEQLERDMDALRERSEEVRVVREEIFREPSCRELGDIDIGSACPALRDRMFERADGLN